MSSLDEILKESMDKLDILKNQVEVRKENIEADRDDYIDSNSNILNSIDTFEEEPIITIDIPKENIPYIKKISDILDEFKCEYDRIKQILEYDTDKNLTDFFKLVELLHEIDPYGLLERIKSATEICDKKYLVVTREIENVNLRFNKAKQIVERSLRSGTYMVSKTNYKNLRKRSDLLKNQKGKAVVKEIKDLIRLNEPFFSKTLSFLESTMESLNSPIISDESYNNEMNRIERKKLEITEKIREFDNQLDDSTKYLVEINKIYELYDKYIHTNDNDILNSLLIKLSNFKLISQRDVKILTYEKEEISEEIEITKVKEIYEPVIIKPKTLDNDYFRDSSTKCIICFLGEENDTIKEDIEKHFDNSARKPVLDELYNIFTTLSLQEEYIRNKGGKPHNSSSKKILSLLKSPYDFEYRRYGVGRDNFRIHAITRYSSLLEELGYGEGRIIFFGAVGVNDDKLKTDAYYRIGRRAVKDISCVHSKLSNNFDYIEHITRKYIPLDLLSDQDKFKNNMGQFGFKNSDKIDASIEGGKYIYYDLLDKNSQSNVKEYLDDYFVKQTTILFDLMKDYVKDKTICQSLNYNYPLKGASID